MYILYIYVYIIYIYIYIFIYIYIMYIILSGVYNSTFSLFGCNIMS